MANEYKGPIYPRLTILSKKAILLLWFNFNERKEKMQITLTGHQIDLGASWREYAEKAIDGVVTKYFEKAREATVSVSHEGNDFKTEITVRPGIGLKISSSGQAVDAYGALDEALRKMGTQLKKYKNKMVEHKADSLQKVAVSVLSAPEEEPIGDAPVIIAEMQEDMPTCTVSQAVMQMDLAGLPAYLFRNSAHGELNMVYRRNDGNIGWVDPNNKK